MRSWVYYIELIAHYEDGNKDSASAVYVVALPDEEPLSPVDMECYASEYAPAKLALSLGRAYAIGIDIPISEPNQHSIQGYRDELDLYVFREGMSFEEGLREVYRILYQTLKRENLIAVEPVIDVGCPPREVMMECLKKALSA